MRRSKILSGRISPRNDSGKPGYFALKSQLEIYYQLASVFQEAAGDRSTIADLVYCGLMPEESCGSHMKINCRQV